MSKEWVRRAIFWAISFASILAFGEFGQVAFAQNSPISLPNPLSTNSLQGVVASVTKFLYVIAVPLVTIMALVGGFQMITSSGNPEKFANGRKTLLYAVVGFAIVILAGGIAQIIKNFL